jgi:predicted HicB family RNase H-like nuclease
MNYKGYEAVVEYDDEAKLLHGEVLHLNDVITFQADCIADLEQAFHESVDDYLVFCAENNRPPEKPYLGNISLRISPELHREVASAAKRKKESINSYIAEALVTYTTTNDSRAALKK